MTSVRVVVSACVLFAVMALGGVDAGEYWTELSQGGEVLSARLGSATAYCSALDVMVVIGGVTSSGSMTSDGFVYDFSSAKFSVLDTTGSGLPGLQEAVVVNVDPAEAAPGSCRFLLWGGTTSAVAKDSPRSGVLSTSNSVFVVDLFEWTEFVVNATVAEVTVLGAGLAGRFGAEALGFRDAMFVHAGLRASTSTGLGVTTDDMWRFDMNASLPLGEYEGSWTQVVDSETNRFFFSSAVVGDQWVAYAGQGVEFNSFGVATDVARSTVVSFDLEDLYAASSVVGSATTTQLTYPRAQRVYRIGHTGASIDDTYFAFGGRKLEVGRTTNTLSTNDYVSLTEIKVDEETIGCDELGDNVGWCGFLEEHPGEFEEVEVVQRRDTMVVYVFDPFRGTNELWSLNLTNVKSSAGRALWLDAKSLEDVTTDEDFSAIRSLQYALIAVCVFLLLSLCVLFRHRREDMNFDFTAAPRKRHQGVTIEVIEALDLIKYDLDGNHVLVDEDGEEIQQDGNAEHDAEGKDKADGGKDEVDGGKDGDDDDDVHVDEEKPDEGEGDNTPDEEDGDGDGDDNADADADADADEVRVPVKVVLQDGEQAAMVEDDDEHEHEHKHEHKHESREKTTNFMGEEEEEVCPICILEFEQDEIARRLPCQHIFHTDCIEPWLIKKGSCPLCKQHVVTGKFGDDDDDSEESQGGSEDEHPADEEAAEAEAEAETATAAAAAAATGRGRGQGGMMAFVSRLRHSSTPTGPDAMPNGGRGSLPPSAESSGTVSSGNPLFGQ